MPFYLVSVPRRKELEVALRLFGLLGDEKVYAIYVPPQATRVLYDRRAKTPGYIIVEAEDDLELIKLMKKLVKVRRRILEEISEDEIKELIRPKIAFKPGMKVEIVRGPFAGHLAVVERVRESKEMVGVRLADEEFDLYVEVSPEDLRPVEEE